MKKTRIRWYKMKRSIFIIVLIVCFSLSLFGQDVIERIEIEGNERVTTETILYYISLREADFYNKDLLIRDFKVLWSTGFFSNIKILSEDGTQGKIVRIIVEENPVISKIVYKTGKRLKQKDINEKLRENDDQVLVYSYYSPCKIQRIKETVRDLLEEKGLVGGDIKVELEKKGKNELEVIFLINEGSRMKVGEIVFEGDPELPDRILSTAVKENKPHGLLSWITGKHNFKKDKLDADLLSLKELLQEKGYMEAIIGEPRIEEIKKRSIFLKKQKMKKLIIPINAGEPYSVGRIAVEGNKIFNTAGIRDLIKLKEGEIFNAKSIEKSVEKIGELYNNLGYLYAQVVPVESLDPKKKLVNVTFNINEGEATYVRRLEIEGNTYTKDKVIRREILLTEGMRFSLALFKDSILRMRQLGLVELEGEPDIQPNPENPAELDIALHVKELQRNNVQFSAGYSQYEGTFLALSYSTANFLGAGETMEIATQYGKRVKNYSFGFSEPYIFDLPVTVGFNIYSRFSAYPQLFDQLSRGIDLQFSARVVGYWRTGIVYSYQYLILDEPSIEDDYYYSSYYNSSYYNSYYYGSYGYGSYNVSSVTPTIYKSTVDSPITPSRGTLYLASCKIAGGPFGGELSFIKPRFEFTHYQPTIGEQRFGIHLEYSFVKPYGGTDTPYWERFYLGGERSIRGFDIYTIGPRDDNNRNMGGVKSLVMNAEYIIPLGGPIYAILFADTGNAWSKKENISLKDLYLSSGLELRIFVPALRVPFRLIFAYNNRMIYSDDSHFAFRFAIGTTF